MNRFRPVTDVQYINVNFRSADQRSFPHIAMQGCLDGTIIRELLRESGLCWFQKDRDASRQRWASTGGVSSVLTGQGQTDVRG